MDLIMEANKAIKAIRKGPVSIDDYIMGRELVLENMHLGSFKKSEAAQIANSLRKNGDRVGAKKVIEEARRSGDTPPELTWGQRLDGITRGDDGKRSMTRVGIGVAGAYMGANVIGNGSLGIPFISTASWNR